MTGGVTVYIEGFAMKEKELLTYLKSLCPEESEGCEWKEFKNLKHAVSGKKGEDADKSNK